MLRAKKSGIGMILGAGWCLAIAQAQPSAVEAGNDTPLTLDGALQVALHHHGDIGAAGQNFISAREGITSARSNLYPQVDASLNYNYRSGSTTSNTGGNSNTVAGTTTGLSVSQNVFDGGRTKAQVRQAQARALGAVGSVGSARGNLAYEVARNFYEQLRQQKLVSQRQGQLDLAQKQLEQIQAQIEAGTAARTDAQGVRVNLSQARFDLATARNELRTAETNLRNSLGLARGPALHLQESPLAVETAPPAEEPTNELPGVTGKEILPFPLPTVEPLPVVPAVQTLDDYLKQARDLRPDLLQARATVQQTEAALDIAKIAQRPQVTATAGYNIDPRSVRDRGLTFSAGVSIPLFDAGGRKADARAAQADVEANRIRLTQLDKDVAADVEATFVDIGGQVERIANARELVQQAQVNLQTATEKYRLGLGIVLDIVNAQTQLFNAQTSLTQAVYDYELARANLDRAVGRFAWADPGQTPPPAAPQRVSQELPIVAAKP